MPQETDDVAQKHAIETWNNGDGGDWHHVGTRYVFVIYTIADKVEKVGEVWYTHFLGSWESLAFGAERPFKDNARVKITFEEIQDDQPNQPSV